MFRYHFCFKQKTAYEMRISDWSSDVCSSDLHHRADRGDGRRHRPDEPDGKGHRPVRGEGISVPDARHERADRRMRADHGGGDAAAAVAEPDRKSVVEGTRVSVRVNLGGRRTINTKNIYTVHTSIRLKL